jgi:hypothetical protein
MRKKLFQKIIFHHAIEMIGEYYFEKNSIIEKYI